MVVPKYVGLGHKMSQLFFLAHNYGNLRMKQNKMGVLFYLTDSLPFFLPKTNMDFLAIGWIFILFLLH